MKTVNDKRGEMCKEGAMAYIKIMTQYLPGTSDVNQRTVDNRIKIQTRDLPNTSERFTLGSKLIVN